MADFIELTCKKLESNLEKIGNQPTCIIEKSKLSIHCIQEGLKQIKEYIALNDFPSQTHEIQFFKQQKPSIFSKLIYFVNIFRIEYERPNWSDKSQKEHLNNELDKLEKFFIENVQFYQYMRNNMTYLDDKYFVRSNADLHLNIDTYYFETDHIFSTSHDFKASCILANHLLTNYIKNELEAIDQKENSFPDKTHMNQSDFFWSGNKIDLVELIYALHASGSINKGKADIKDIAKFIESIFGIELGDYYRTYLQIRSRQHPTKFLDSLKEAFLMKNAERDCL